METIDTVIEVPNFTNYLKSFLTKLYEFRCKDELIDVVLIAGADGTRIPAHRLVLCVSSEYFAAMLLGDFRERNETEITLGEMEGDVLTTLIDFCYTGCLKFSDDMLDRLLRAASLLRLEMVLEVCYDHILSALSLENCFHYLEFTQKYYIKELHGEVKLFICQHLTELCDRHEFLMLEFEQLNEFLASDELRADSEEEIFNCIEKWTQHKYNQRRQYVDQLLGYVRLALLSTSFIVERVKSVCSTNNTKEMLIDALLFKLEVNISRSSTLCLQRRTSKNTLIAIDRSDNHLQVQHYSASDDSWYCLDGIWPKRHLFGAVCCQYDLVLVGGQNEHGFSCSVHSLNLKNKKTTTLCNLLVSRSALGVAVLNDMIYAVGGYDGSTVLKSVERYDSAYDIWESVASMSSARDYVSVCVYRNVLYAVGGCNENRCLRSVERYNVEMNSWSLCACMIQPRASVGIAANENFLYVFGGFTKLKQFQLDSPSRTVERYDFDTNTWTMVCSLSSERAGMSCVHFGKRILVMGGTINGNSTNIVEEYDEEKDMWQRRKPLIFKHSYGCVVIAPNIF